MLVEKRTLVEQLRAWFDPYGVAIVALGGYESETLDRLIRSEVAADGRPAVALDGEDMDPTGEDIERNVGDHCGHVYESLERVALTWHQIDHHTLSVLAGKRSDSRAAGFARRHGRLAQVEIEALDPDDLTAYFEVAIAEWFDMTQWEDVMEQERSDREYLVSLAEGSRP